MKQRRKRKLLKSSRKAEITSSKKVIRRIPAKRKKAPQTQVSRKSTSRAVHSSDRSRLLRSPAKIRGGQARNDVIARSASDEAPRLRSGRSAERFLSKYEAISGRSDLKDNTVVSESRPASGELPAGYQETKLVAIVRDPYWIFSYWDLDGAAWQKIRDIYRIHPNNTKSILRVYDVTNLDWNGANHHSAFDTNVHLDAKNWYLELNRPDREWILELGLLDSSGYFHVLARSNRVRTPRDGPSDEVDEQWMIEDYDEIYALSGGLGSGSSQPGKARRKKRRLFERGISSPGISSFRPRSR